jgi:hypothetical protein
VDPFLLSTWQEDKATIDDWTERFGIAATAKEGCTDEDLNASAALKEVAKHFKTPFKPSHKSNEEENACVGTYRGFV